MIVQTKPIDPRDFGPDVSVRPRVQTLGEGGKSQGNPTGVANVIFSWREIPRCFWETGVFLGREIA